MNLDIRIGLDFDEIFVCTSIFDIVITKRCRHSIDASASLVDTGKI